MPDTTAPRALVFGGRHGLLGQALMRTLKSRGWEALSLGREDGDLLDQGWMSEQIRQLQPQAIFNAVAFTQVDDAEDQPAAARRINRDLPALLGHLLKGTGIHLLHYSTDFVFNGRKDSPYKTDDTPNPLCVYGRTKLEGEKALAASGLETCCVLRTSWLFGPGRKNFVKTILDLARQKETLSVVHDQIGSPSYTMDVAAASLDLLRCKATGIFHLANCGQVSWCELAAQAVALADFSCAVQAIDSADWPQKAKRPAFSSLDVSRYTEVTGNVMRPWLPALRDYVFQDFIGSGDEDSAPQ